MTNVDDGNTHEHKDGKRCARDAYCYGDVFIGHIPGVLRFVIERSLGTYRFCCPPPPK